MTPPGHRLLSDWQENSLWRGMQLVFAALLLALVPAQTAYAKSVQRCQGTNILDNLATSHPELHKETLARAAATKNAGAIMWRITKPGVPTSTLFGTMHVSDPRIAIVPDSVKARLLKSSSVALEIADMSPTAMMGAIQANPSLMVFTDGRRLSQLIAPDEFQTLGRIITAQGLPAPMADLVRPWFATLLMAIPACEQRRIAAGKKVLDVRLGDLAKANDIPLVSLETINEQLNAMASIPDDHQLAILRLTLAHADTMEDQFEMLMQAYEKRQMGIALHYSRALAKISNMPPDSFASFEKHMINIRNQKMLRNSLPLVNKGGAFIAVGALHLVGDQGLVELFRRAGFTVTALL